MGGGEGPPPRGGSGAERFRAYEVNSVAANASPILADDIPARVTYVSPGKAFTKNGRRDASLSDRFY